MTRPSYDPDWRQRWAHKIRSADDALKVVRSGQHIFVGSGAASPQFLVERLTARADYLHAAEIIHIMTLGLAPYALSPVKEAFRHNAFFVGPNVREAVTTGEADYTPIFLSEVAGLFRSGRVPLDVALIQVTPPDEHGFCSLGIEAGLSKTAAQKARIVIADAPYWQLFPLDDGERVDCLNAVYVQAAREHGADVIGLREWLCPDRRCAVARDDVVLRPDGVHFMDAGADIAGRWVLGEITRLVLASP